MPQPKRAQAKGYRGGRGGRTGSRTSPQGARWSERTYKGATHKPYVAPPPPVLGPFYKANRAAVLYHEEAFERQQGRKGAQLWPRYSKVDGLYREETPFGTVTAGPAASTDFTEAPDLAHLVYKVAIISTRSEDYSHIPGAYSTYEQLAPGLTQELAGLVLMEVYDTIGRFSDPENRESETARHIRSLKAQKGYAHLTPEQRRVMATFYALAVFSEDQRNAGGKAMRAALWRVFAGKRTAEQVFGGNEPDFAQARAQKLLAGFGTKEIGGREYDRLIRKGYIKLTQHQRAFGDVHSEASDDEGATADHRRALVPKLRELLQPYLDAPQSKKTTRAVRDKVSKIDLSRGKSIRARQAGKAKSATATGGELDGPWEGRTRSKTKQGMKRTRSGEDELEQEQKPLKRYRPVRKSVKAYRTSSRI